MNLVRSFALFCSSFVSIIFCSTTAFSAPPYPGVWQKTRLGFKSESGVMYFSPEAILPKPSLQVKSQGTINCVVLLAEFQDKKFNVKIGQNSYDPKEYFSELIFGSLSKNMYYKFPSFKDYWEINSGGKLNVQGQVFGPYVLSSTLSDYACGVKNGGGRYCGLGSGTGAIASELIRLADGEVDFSKFDGNADNAVDCFIIIHSGKGGEVQENPISSSQCCDIWSHAFSTYISTSDGVSIRSGVIAAGISEIFPYGNMGLIAHEFGHLLGLVDLYDAGASGLVSCGVGPYSLMGYGLYKGPKGALGTLPSNLSPWEKIYLGWAEALTVSGQFCDKISSSSASTYFLKVPAYSSADSKEYFLLEFRKRENFDSDFPVDGVLIWHIDEQIVRERVGSNRVNTDECFPGCGSSCGEVKDNKGLFLTCQNHYGIRVVPRSSKSDPWLFERTNINEDSSPCLLLDSQDFWVKGTKFPDSYTSAFGYRGVEHNVLVVIYSDELNNINIAATNESSKIVLKGPTIKGVERYDWVSPRDNYVAKLRVQGTSPIFLRSVFPQDLLFRLGDNFSTEMYISSERGYVDQDIEVFLKNPRYGEMIQSITISVENCVERVLEEWTVKVQNRHSTVDSNPVSSDGSGQVWGCACETFHPISSIPTIFLVSVFFISYIKIRKIFS